MSGVATQVRNLLWKKYFFLRGAVQHWEMSILSKPWWLSCLSNKYYATANHRLLSRHSSLAATVISLKKSFVTEVQWILRRSTCWSLHCSGLSATFEEASNWQLVFKCSLQRLLPLNWDTATKWPEITGINLLVRTMQESEKAFPKMWNYSFNTDSCY